MRKVEYVVLVLVLLISGSPDIFAQEAGISTGGEASGSGGSVSYSMGQLTYRTNSGTTGSMAQGVQQAYEISKVTGTAETGISLRISAYPNPVSDVLILNIPGDLQKGYQYSLIDMNGKIIRQQLISANETSIGMEALEPAVYFVKVSTGEKGMQTFKIIKN